LQEDVVACYNACTSLWGRNCGKSRNTSSVFRDSNLRCQMSVHKMSAEQYTVSGLLSLITFWKENNQLFSMAATFHCKSSVEIGLICFSLTG